MGLFWVRTALLAGFGDIETGGPPKLSAPHWQTISKACIRTFLWGKHTQVCDMRCRLVLHQSSRFGHQKSWRGPRQCRHACADYLPGKVPLEQAQVNIYCHLQENIESNGHLLSDKTRTNIFSAYKQNGNNVGNSLPSEASDTVSLPSQNGNGPYFVVGLHKIIPGTTASRVHCICFQ